MQGLGTTLSVQFRHVTDDPAAYLGGSVGRLLVGPEHPLAGPGLGNKMAAANSQATGASATSDCRGGIAALRGD